MEAHNNDADNTLHQQQRPHSSLISQLDAPPSLGDGMSQAVDRSQGGNSQTNPLRCGHQQQQQHHQGNNCNNNTAVGKLFVGQVPYIATEDLLRPLFEPYGTIMEIKIMRDGDGRSKGCAWVRYETQEQAQGAIEALHDKHTIPPQTNMLQVRFAQPSQGGGRGGGGRGWNNRFSGYHGQQMQGQMRSGWGQYGYNQGGYTGGYLQGPSPGGFGGRGGGSSGWNNPGPNGYPNQSVTGSAQQHGGYFSPSPQNNQSQVSGSFQQSPNSMYFSSSHGGGGGAPSHQSSNQQLWT